MLNRILMLSVSVALLAGETGSRATVTNLAGAAWTHDKGDPPGSESVLLRQDAKTGGMELLVRYPAGHVIAPHRHDSNERMIVLEGQMTLGQESGAVAVDAGGVAYLPAGEVQRLSCTSRTRCTFYLAWDGSPRSHRVR